MPGVGMGLLCVVTCRVLPRQCNPQTWDIKPGSTGSTKREKWHRFENLQETQKDFSFICFLSHSHSQHSHPPILPILPILPIFIRILISFPIPLPISHPEGWGG